MIGIMSEIIEIDGSIGEGGGQILRTSFGLAALLQKPVQISKIRASRPKPGLKPQHLTALQALSKVCGDISGNVKLSSSSVAFFPKNIVSSQFIVNIGTAGSISLLIQQLLPVALKADLKIRICGGTNVDWSPPIEFLQYALFPILKRMNARFEVKLAKRGYYPKGQGAVMFISKKAKLPLKPIVLKDFSELDHVKIFSHSANLPTEVSQNQFISAKKTLQEKFPEIFFDEQIESKKPSATIGSGITLIAFDTKNNMLSASVLGSKEKPAVVVGMEAAQKLLEELSSKKAVDSHTADQLIPFMALAKGKSIIYCSKLTRHTLTNISICEQLLPVKFEVKGELGTTAEISVEGIAFK